MRIHTQTAIAYAHNEKRDHLYQVERHAHTALAVTCPRCEAKGGFQCRQGGTFMPKLAVHIERQEAAL